MAPKKENNSPTADREITVTRLLNAPRELVFELWTKPEHIKHWWGPNGFTNTIFKMDVKPGGDWEYMMHGPDGTDYRNHNVFEEIVWPEKIVLQHASGPNFKMTITFTEQGEKTLLRITSLFESAEQLKEVVRLFKADEGLKQNVDKLETYLQQMPFSPDLVLTRIINAPIQMVFDAWTKPEHLQNWWGPKNFTNPVCRADAKPGGEIYIDMTGPDGTPYPCRGNYHQLNRPDRIVFSITAYNDENNVPSLDVFYIVALEEQAGKTKLTLTAKIMKATPEMAQAIQGMNQGWSESLDRLIQLTEIL